MITNVGILERQKFGEWGTRHITSAERGTRIEDDASDLPKSLCAIVLPKVEEEDRKDARSIAAEGTRLDEDVPCPKN